MHKFLILFVIYFAIFHVVSGKETPLDRFNTINDKSEIAELFEEGNAFNRYVSNETWEGWKYNPANLHFMSVNETNKQLEELSAKFPHIAHTYSIGKSVEGFDMKVIVISDSPKEHELGEPEVFYLSTMAGNEIVGHVLLWELAKVLVENYGNDPFLTRLVNQTRIHLLLHANPDGYTKSDKGSSTDDTRGRTNSRGVVLNRNFPEKYHDTNVSARQYTAQQVETTNIINYLHTNNFALGISFHAGDLVANYPRDGRVDGGSVPRMQRTSDEALFRNLAFTYSVSHKTMANSDNECPNSKHFKHGIVNGANWFPMYGGMNDYVYDFTNGLMISVELGCVQRPRMFKLPELWVDNRSSLVNFLVQVHRGVKGLVYEDTTMKRIANAKICCQGDLDARPLKTTKDGEYWRLLNWHITTNLTYNLSASASGYQTAYVQVDGYNRHTVQHVHFAMKPLQPNEKQLPSRCRGLKSLADRVKLNVVIWTYLALAFFK